MKIKPNKQQAEKLRKRIAEIKAGSVHRKEQGRPNISLQTYKPDTCDCLVVQCVDKEKAERAVLDHLCVKCPAHAMLEDEDCWNAIRGDTFSSEQIRKNRIEGMLMDDDAIGLNAEEWDADQERSVKQLRPGLIYNWRFTGEGADRVLHVDLVQKATPTKARAKALQGLSAAQRTRFDECCASFGPGRVVIDA